MSKMEQTSKNELLVKHIQAERQAFKENQQEVSKMAEIKAKSEVI